jgi:hypothetical protein
MDIVIKTNTEVAILITLIMEKGSSRIENRALEITEAISGEATTTRRTREVITGQVQLADTMNHRTIQEVLSNITSTHMPNILTVNW